LRELSQFGNTEREEVKMYNCEECYKQASEQVKGLKGDIEENGALAYEFLHYEWNHGNKEKAGY
jgi:hypothetical protein